MSERPETKNPFVSAKVIKTDCNISDYLNTKCEDGQIILSRGDLVEIANNPHRWRCGFRRPDDRTPSKEFGSLFDCLLTQPHKLDQYYTLAPESYENKKGETKPWTWKSSTCREWRDEIESGGKLVCGKEDLAEAQSAIKALIEHPKHGEQIKRLLSGATFQVFCISEYVDAASKMRVWVKTLTDLVPNVEDEEFGKTLFDIKTACTAHPKPWRRAVFDNNYHVQAALGLDAYTLATGEDRTDFRHLIVENFHPWEPAKRFLATEFIDAGRMKVANALKTFCECTKTGEWPGYYEYGQRTLADGFEACEVEAWMVGQ